MDYLLDYGSGIHREEALRKLSWNYCKDYFLGNTSLKENTVIDLLYEKISIGMRNIRAYNNERAKYIIQLLKQAIDAEENVIKSSKRELFSKSAVLNKSILFVKIAVEILLCKKMQIKNNDRRVIESLGYIFALIDDLCDLYEDMEIGQMNILVEYMKKVNTDDEAERVIKIMVARLGEGLQILSENVAQDLYEFILQEVKEWSMSNIEIRKRIWKMSKV